MLRILIPVIIALAIAFGLGAYGADRATAEFDGFGALEIGAWKAFPDAATTNADPYARARSARTGRIGLGSAEGLVFVATRDNAGQPLTSACSYTVTGRMANARLWTLRITDNALRTLPDADNEPVATHSRETIRNDDDGFTLKISPQIQPGNWLEMPQGENLRFVATLYDTAVASSSGITELTMPVIAASECRDG